MGNGKPIVITKTQEWWSGTAERIDAEVESVLGCPFTGYKWACVYVRSLKQEPVVVNKQNVVFITLPKQFITCLFPTTEGRTIIKNISESQKYL